MNNYDDIIHLDRPVSIKHKKMDIDERAKIFSAFQALKGYDDAIDDASDKTVIAEIEHVIYEEQP